MLPLGNMGAGGVNAGDDGMSGDGHAAPFAETLHTRFARIAAAQPGTPRRGLCSAARHRLTNGV